jgi:ferredoxin
MTKPLVVALRPGPHDPTRAAKENSFQGQNLKIIISLAPLIVIWLIYYPGLWLVLALALAYGLGQLTKSWGRSAPARDLDPLAGSLAALALLGPDSLMAAILAGLSGGLLTVFPGLIKWPGLIGALLGAILGIIGPLMGLTLTATPPAAKCLWALSPGAIWLTISLYRKNPRFLGPFGLWVGLAALAPLVSQADLTHLPLVFIMAFWGPFKPSGRCSPLGLLAGLGAIYGGFWGYLGGLALWGLTGGRGLKTLPSPEPLEPDQPINPQPFNPTLFHPTRLCLRAEGSPRLIGQAPEPWACRLGSLAYACFTACLGLGDCVMACPTGALSLAPDLAPSLAPSLAKTPIFQLDLCQGCGSCLTACPLGLIRLIPASARVIIPCRGQETLKVMDQLCAKGCLGCGRCAKACPGQALTRREFGPPLINHQRCSLWLDCQWACQKACPKGLPRAITPNSN